MSVLFRYIIQPLAEWFILGVLGKVGAYLKRRAESRAAGAKRAAAVRRLEDNIANKDKVSDAEISESLEDVLNSVDAPK